MFITFDEVCELWGREGCFQENGSPCIGYSLFQEVSQVLKRKAQEESLFEKRE